MSDENKVMVSLPTEEFRTLAARYRAEDKQSLGEAFDAASAQLAEKEKRNFVVKLLDFKGDGIGSAPLTGYDGATLDVRLNGMVDISMPSKSFATFARGAHDGDDGISAAFKIASENMRRLEGRLDILSYIDIADQVIHTPVPAYDGAMLRLMKQ